VLLEVIGDYPTFEKDLRIWCRRFKKVLLSARDEEQKRKVIQIQF
jgi:TusA-related sulfurtransferase